MRHLTLLIPLLFATTGCLGGSKKSGAPSDDSAPPATETECEVAAGELIGTVYYWGLPGNPDSIAADSVDVLLARGGVTYRTGTTPLGAFNVLLETGAWAVAADDHRGCMLRVEEVNIEPCETTELELVLDLCEF